MSNLVYLTAPYGLKIKSKEFGANTPPNNADKKELKYSKFCKVAAGLINGGYYVGSGVPLAHSVSELVKIPDFVGGFEASLIPNFDIVMVICLEGWENCEHLKKEIQCASEHKIPVIYISEDLKIVGNQVEVKSENQRVLDFT